MTFRLSPHAAEELHRRGIPRELVDQVLAAPQQIIEERGGRSAYQSQIEFPEGRVYLLRVIVQAHVEPAVVITAYRTSRIRKYWSQP